MSDAPHRTWPVLQVSGLSETAADLLQADLLDFDVEAIDEGATDGWRIFFRTTASRDQALAHVRRAFSDVTATPLAIADEDWAARSQSGLKAVTVGGIILAPPWDVPLTIVIQPLVVYTKPAKSSRQVGGTVCTSRLVATRTVTLFPSSSFPLSGWPLAAAARTRDRSLTGAVSGVTIAGCRCTSAAGAPGSGSSWYSSLSP